MPGWKELANKERQGKRGSMRKREERKGEEAERASRVSDTRCQHAEKESRKELSKRERSRQGCRRESTQEKKSPAGTLRQEPRGVAKRNERKERVKTREKPEEEIPATLTCRKPLLLPFVFLFCF